MTVLTFTTNTEKRYKQVYKQHMDRLYPIYQSKEVHINGESYVLIGQKRMHENPLFSDFDVFNVDGESADEATGDRVHEFMARLIMTQEIFAKINESVAGLVNEQLDGSFLKEHFYIKNEQQVNQLTALTMVHEHMTALIDLVNNFSELESFNETNRNELADKWKAFIKAYELRADALRMLYEDQPNKEVAFTDESAILLWKEAKIVYHLYEMITPQGADLGTVSITDWIEHNYAWARFRQSDMPMKKRHRFERGMYTFIVYLYRFVVWLFTPLVLLVLYTDGELTFGSALPLISFAIVGSVVKSQNKASLLKKIDKDILNYRAARG